MPRGFFDALAGPADAAIGSALSGTAKAGARAVGRGIKGAALGAVEGAGAAAHALMWGAPRAVGLGIGMTRGAAELAHGAATNAYKAARWMGGGRIFEQGEHLFSAGGRSFHMPRFTGAVEDRFVFGALGLAGVAGAASAFGNSTAVKGGWGVTSGAGGVSEVESDRFMGATGSLALAMGRRTAYSQTPTPYQPGPLSRYAMYGHLADDALMAGMRMFR